MNTIKKPQTPSKTRVQGLKGLEARFGSSILSYISENLNRENKSDRQSRAFNADAILTTISGIKAAL